MVAPRLINAPGGQVVAWDTYKPGQINAQILVAMWATYWQKEASKGLSVGVVAVVPPSTWHSTIEATKDNTRSGP